MSTVSLWTSPLADFDSLVRRAFGPTPSAAVTGFRPAAEIDRDGDDAIVRLELPGVDVAEDVTVEVQNGRLTVEGERRDERSGEHDGRTLREVRYGSFRRSFTLPARVSAEAVSADYDAGVLSIRIAGAYAGTAPRRIQISGGTAAADVTAEDAAENPGVDTAENPAEGNGTV